MTDSQNRYEGHTPGPWQCRDTKDHVLNSSGRNPIWGVWGPEGDAIALCKGVVAPNEANARLIADAPLLLEQRDALLAMLKRALPLIESEASYWHENSPRGGTGKRLDDFVGELRAAIADVEGQNGQS